jgi:hypothetical protein
MKEKLTDYQVHAVYPSISQEKLVTMTADQIIAQNPSSYPPKLILIVNLTA